MLSISRQKLKPKQTKTAIVKENVHAEIQTQKPVLLSVRLSVTFVYFYVIINHFNLVLFLWATCKRLNSPTCTLASSPILYVVMSSIFSLSASHTILVFNKASSGLSATAELLVLFEYIGSGR